MTTAAIILAGGASRRFGRDKLAEPLDGRPLLESAIDPVRTLASTLVVVLAPGDDRALPSGAIPVHDPVPHEGPLAGLVAGLRTLGDDVDRVIVLGGDMPSVVPSVLEALLARLGDPAVGAAWLQDAEGRERPLPLAVRRATALERASRLLDGGERRLRALPPALGATAIPSPTWLALDPSAGTLRDVDEPADLDSLR